MLTSPHFAHSSHFPQSLGSLRTPQQAERPGENSPENGLYLRPGGPADPRSAQIFLAKHLRFVEQPLVFQHLCEGLAEATFD